MPFEKVTIDAVELVGPSDEAVPPGAEADSVGGVRILSDGLDTDSVSINQYELNPGESSTVSIHRHWVQEELFYIVSGTVTFESQSAEMAAEAGEIVRIPPGTFQLGTNEGDDQATALAIGAPQEYEEETEWLVDCEVCGDRTINVYGEAEADGEYRFECIDCGNETFRVS
jgi:uncharacterized cupin superfamily protein